jgi:hypothetical protein
MGGDGSDLVHAINPSHRSRRSPYPLMNVPTIMMMMRAAFMRTLIRALDDGANGAALIDIF